MTTSHTYTDKSERLSQKGVRRRRVQIWGNFLFPVSKKTKRGDQGGASQRRGTRRTSGQDRKQIKKQQARGTRYIVSWSASATNRHESGRDDEGWLGEHPLFVSWLLDQAQLSGPCPKKASRGQETHTETRIYCPFFGTHPNTGCAHPSPAIFIGPPPRLILITENIQPGSPIGRSLPMGDGRGSEQKEKLEARKRVA